MGRKRRKETTLITVIAAAILVIVLLTAGTVLRMQTQGMGAWQAFSSFVRDTFSAGA